MIATVCQPESTSAGSSLIRYRGRALTSPSASSRLVGSASETRPRRAPSLDHLRGEPWARIGERVGQRNLAVTANTYTHVLTDETELDYEALLGG